MPYNTFIHKRLMTATSKKLSITITGETFSDLEIALEEVKKYIEDEYLSGFGSNETGDYEFDVTEELK